MMQPSKYWRRSVTRFIRIQSEKHKSRAASALLLGALFSFLLAVLITTGVLHGSDSRGWAQLGLLLGFSSLLFRP